MARSGTASPKGARESGTRRVTVVAYIGDDGRFAAELGDSCARRGVVLARELPAPWHMHRHTGVLVVDSDSGERMPAELRKAGFEDGRLVVARGSVTHFTVEQRVEASRAALAALESARNAEPQESMLLGGSRAMREVRAQIEDVAHFHDVSVMIVGETGTGKDLAARALHAAGSRRGAFVGVNCAAVPGPLFESELFGHRSGTFTGAQGNRAGLMDEARDGTLFLDEIGELERGLQPKLLRTLDHRAYRPVGANREKPLTARVISATNRDISTHAGLRPDLFFRLASFVVKMPALRSRRDDIEQLASAFLTRFSERYGMLIPDLRANAIGVLQAHDWPGNVRELKTTLERAAILSRGRAITAGLIANQLPKATALTPIEQTPALRSTCSEGRGLRDVEREIVMATLEANDGNVAQTARQLALPRSTLRAWLRRYRVG